MPVHKGNRAPLKCYSFTGTQDRSGDRKFCFDRGLAVPLERKTASGRPVGRLLVVSHPVNSNSVINNQERPSSDLPSPIWSGRPIQRHEAMN